MNLDLLAWLAPLISVAFLFFLERCYFNVKSLDFTRFTRRFSSSVLQLFKHHRTQLIEMTVSTFAIIKHFDVFKYL